MGLLEGFARGKLTAGMSRKQVEQNASKPTVYCISYNHKIDMLITK